MAMVVNGHGHRGPRTPRIASNVVDAVKRAASQAAHNIDVAVATILSVEQIVWTGRHTRQGAPGIGNRVILVGLRVLGATDGVATKAVDAGAVTSHGRAVHRDGIHRSLRPRPRCTSRHAGGRRCGSTCYCRCWRRRWWRSANLQTFGTGGHSGAGVAGDSHSETINASARKTHPGLIKSRSG